MAHASSGMQRIIEHKLPEHESQTFILQVNYGQSVEEALKAGSYDWANDNLTSEHFPSLRRGIETVEVHLVHFGRSMTPDEITTELEKQGLRPATIEELLALGATYPDLQRQFPIIALGLVWMNPGGLRRAPVLGGSGCERRARLLWFVVAWSSSYRFAAVCR